MTTLQEWHDILAAVSRQSAETDPLPVAQWRALAAGLPRSPEPAEGARQTAAAGTGARARPVPGRAARTSAASRFQSVTRAEVKR
ncbi:hypothetical protein ThrDRAFT_04653 [Frankia casuarinae]|nr:hypothetical protein CcI6DRAFT_03936 [Frankia sp. CcI6]EYT89724.1 hypothetical protein ThrDRAFT_04653 [Frankia casuarinae]KDA41573.1 hypothetical protein BMG523Draft_03575 [Frankia sp. BMG5.23]KEZ35065.1 hypothetical protein CEDDRAFT_03549 [Frankia sp. CeD]KFB03154.1 hypothetical protein ALLO2DRAFT_04123 [Frankia sp. Allo2]